MKLRNVELIGFPFSFILSLCISGAKTSTVENPDAAYFQIGANKSARENPDPIKGSAALDRFPLIDTCSLQKTFKEEFSRIRTTCSTPFGRAVNKVLIRKNYLPELVRHNDLAWTLAIYKENQLKNIDLTKNLTDDPTFKCPACAHTDIPKLKAGKVGAQFWSAYVSCKMQYKDAVGYTLEQIDVIKRFVQKYSNYFQFATSTDDITNAIKNKRIASLIGIEGGHSIEYKLSILRTYYELGVRYMTLTHTCDVPWADASPLDTNIRRGLTEFGKKVIMEMNRLGMLVDLSHVSYHVMKAALEVTRAPIIFSHSSAYKVHPHHRNVRDDILKLVKEGQGVVMVNFFVDFVGPENASMLTIANHINHIVDVCGIGCVGFGADFNGVPKLPKGLEDVSKYPDLLDFLREKDPKRWTLENLEKLAGRNIMRVFKEVEQVRDSLKSMEPIEDWISEDEVKAIGDHALKHCTSNLRQRSLFA